MKQVYHLIETMSQREKAYFTSLNKSNKDKLYFQIYGQIENSKNQEEVLHFFLKKNNSRARFNVEINYLYNHLLRSLHIYRFNSKDPSQSLLKQLQFVHILLEKNLNKYAFKILSRLKKQAYKYEEYSILNNVIGLEEDICFSSVDSDLPKKLKKLFEERSRCIKLIEELNHLKLIKMQIIDLQYKNGLFIDQDDPKIKILKDPSLYKTSKDSKKIQDLRLFCKSVGFLLIAEYKKSEKEMEKRIQFIKSNPILFSKSELFKAINNYLFLCSFTKDINAFNIKIKELRSYKKEMELPSPHLLFTEYYTTLRIHSILKNNVELSKLLKKISKDQKEFFPKLNPTEKDELYFHIIYAYIVLEKFDQALHHLNQWIISGYEDFSFKIVKIFKLIIFSQKGEFIVLENELKSAVQIFRKKKVLNAVDKCLFSYFKAITQKNKPAKLATKTLQNDLKKLSVNKKTKKYFAEFDFYQWSKTI